MEVYKTDSMKIPAKTWSKIENIECGALKQIETACSLPFVFKHIAVMPDCHTGYSCPIGSVIATKNVVVPFFVGVDIGCGMCAVRTPLTYIDTDTLKKIINEIREVIPVGKNHHKEKQKWDGFMKAPFIDVIGREWQSAQYQLGTLGGGNHFIEIQKGSDGFIWIMIHSGSRNFGYKIAKEYNKIAQGLCTKWYSNIPVFKGEDGLAFLPLDTQEGQDYLEVMNYAVDFALANRELMMNRILKCFTDNFTRIITRDKIINIAHNYAVMEHHFNNNVMIHRKGATSAQKDLIGIIPGSQGTSSFIVKGKGNPDSFNSCSHGAGRAMSRTKAKAELNLEEEQKKLETQGIIHSIRSQAQLDEAISAYKDINIVMEEQKDLVDIVVELKPLAVIKG